MLLTLIVYATGGHLMSVGDFIRCDKSTVSRIVKKVTREIASLASMPRNQEEIAQRQNDFYEVALSFSLFETAFVALFSIRSLYLSIKLARNRFSSPE